MFISCRNIITIYNKKVTRSKILRPSVLRLMLEEVIVGDIESMNKNTQRNNFFFSFTNPLEG